MEKQIMDEDGNEFFCTEATHIQHRKSVFCQLSTAQIEKPGYSGKKEPVVYPNNTTDINHENGQENNAVVNVLNHDQHSNNCSYCEYKIDNAIFNIVRHYMDAPRFTKLLITPLFMPLAILGSLYQYPALFITISLCTLEAAVYRLFDAKIMFSFPFVTFSRGFSDLTTTQACVFILILSAVVIYLLSGAIYHITADRMVFSKKE